MRWIGGAGFLDDVIGAVHDVMPGAAVPVIVPREIEHAGAFDVESDIEVVRQLIKEMARVGAFVAAAPVVGAAHVGPSADALQRPLFPAAIGVQANGNDGRIDGNCGSTDQDQR